MKVEVELDDLETLIFATGVIKTIEGTLAARKQDPFVKPHLDFTKAHDALTLAMNSARRSASSGAAVAWDGELTKDEVDLLNQFEISPVSEVSVDARMKNKEIDSLASKGCLRIGQLVGGAVWPGEQRPDIKPLAGFALAITKRGYEKLEQARTKNVDKAK